MYLQGLKYPRSKPIYEKANRITEIICKAEYFIVVRVFVPGFVLPKAIYSYLMYFTTDLGADAFVLPFPTWWVFAFHLSVRPTNKFH